MKMVSKKILAVLLAAVMLPGALAACGTDEPSAPGPSESDAAGTETAEADEDTVYFGYYRIGKDALNEELPKGYLNVVIVDAHPGRKEETADVIRLMREYGGKAWLGVWDTVVSYASSDLLQESWRENLTAAIDALAEQNVLDGVLGFYFDEPLLNGMPKETYKKLTQYMRESWPQLRVLTIFAVNAIAPNVWSSGNDQVLDPETLAYTTDAGFDMYWEVSGDGLSAYKTVISALKKRFGRDDFRVWYVPCIMNFGGKSDGTFPPEHTETMLNFLRNEANPGGLLCYAWNISNRDGDLGNIGLDEMIAKGEGPWTSLYDRLVQIGRMITSGPLFKIVGQPVDYFGASGSTATFTVEAQGSGLTYQWYIRTPGSARFEPTGVTEATYTTELTEETHFSRLYCIVTDAFGNTIKTVVVGMYIN